MAGLAKTGTNAGHEFTSADPVCHRALPFLTKGNATNMPNERPLRLTRPAPAAVYSIRGGASISVPQLPGCVEIGRDEAELIRKQAAHRSVLKNSRTSRTNRSGCSKAAK